MRIVSGGQSGVDRAALDVARSLGLDYGGWCPAGGLAEDRADLLVAYPALRATPSTDPAQRTEWNVRDSDATLVIGPDGKVRSPGTAFTIRCAERAGKPHLVADPTRQDAVRAWLDGLPPDGVLNVAGPRESQAPGVYDAAYGLLRAVLGQPG